MDQEFQGTRSIQAGRDIRFSPENGLRERRQDPLYTDVRHVRTVMRIQALQISLLILLLIGTVMHSIRATWMHNDISEVKAMLFHTLSLNKRGE